MTQPQTTPPRPDWDAYAGAIAHRLRLDVARKSPDPDIACMQANAFPDMIRGPLDIMLSNPGLSFLPPDLIDVVRARGADPEATTATGEEHPPVHIPIAWLLMAMRLGATFGSEARFTDAITSRAVTTLRFPDVRDGEIAALVIRRAMLREGTETTGHPETLHHGKHQLLILRPEGSEGQLPRNSGPRFIEAVRQSLGTNRPMLLLMPSVLRLPDGLRKLLPEPLDLRMPDRDILMATFRRSHTATGRIDEEAALRNLPASGALAQLSGTELAVAFRERTAAAVAAKLGTFTKSGTVHAEGEAISGSGPAAEAGRRIAGDLNDWFRGRVTWNDVTRSLLLWGPPGTGKTWLAGAIAAHAGVPLVSGSFATWQGRGHLGDMLAAMRETFEEAHRRAPCVLFIDEIDAVGARDSGDNHGSNYRRQVINGFLLEIDGILQQEGVIIVAACNNPGVIDPAVIRPGRFDERVEMPLPDADTLMLVLRRHLAEQFPDPELQAIARIAVGCSMADMDAAIRNLRSSCRRAGRVFTLEALKTELNIGGDSQLDWRVAVHECGHAIVATAVGNSRVTRVAITTDGGETARTRLPAPGLSSDYGADLAILLAGRAAEKLILGNISSGSGGGSQSDLSVATTMALSMHTQLGLGWHGPVWSDAPEEIQLRDPQIRQRVRAQLEDAQERASRILSAQRQTLEDMARALIAERQLSGAALDIWRDRITAHRDDCPEVI